MRSPNALLALLLVSVALSAQQYFPPGALDKNPQADQFKANWYSQHLKALTRRPKHIDSCGCDRITTQLPFGW